MDSAGLTQRNIIMSVKLWPPSQGTRLMLVERITKSLTTPSIFSRKYGLLGLEEAEIDAKKIEESAFRYANEHHNKETFGDGSSSVLLYTKMSSKLMLEVLRRGPTVKDNKSFEITEELNRETVFDISGGRRSFIHAEEAEELVKPLKRLGNAYSRICFSNTSFGVDAARVFHPILASLRSQLKEVDLSDFIASRPETEALEVMEIFSSAMEGCQLRYLDLSNNALGEKGIRAFGSLLKSQNNLEELYLINDGISEEAARAVNELIPSTQKLRVLHFHNNMTGDAGAIAISEIVRRSPLLDDFRCSSTRVGSEGGVQLAESFATCTHLRKIDLRDNMFGVEAGLALSKTLHNLVKIVEIYLSYLNLEDKGADALSIALKESAPSLEVLDMAGNDITIKGASALASCIASKQFMTKLNLAENELKDDGAILIAKALEGHKQLSEVDMSCNLIRNAGALHLARAVLNKPKLIMLNINGNCFSDDVINEVRDILTSSLNILGPLDDNDPEGEDYSVEAEEETALGDEFRDVKITQDY